MNDQASDSVNGELNFWTLTLWQIRSIVLSEEVESRVRLMGPVSLLCRPITRTIE
jgi:hypothetical protein